MTLFKDIPIGDGTTFDFIEPGSRDNSFYDKCYKISARKYISVDINNDNEYHIGTINCDVYNVAWATAGAINPDKRWSK